MTECEYCRESERQTLTKIAVQYHFEDEKAICYPEVSNWKKSYELNFCPMCRKIVHKGWEQQRHSNQ